MPFPLELARFPHKFDSFRFSGPPPRRGAHLTEKHKSPTNLTTKMVIRFLTCAPYSRETVRGLPECISSLFFLCVSAIYYPPACPIDPRVSLGRVGQRRGATRRDPSGRHRVPPFLQAFPSRLFAALSSRPSFGPLAGVYGRRLVHRAVRSLGTGRRRRAGEPSHFSSAPCVVCSDVRAPSVFEWS